MSMLSKLAVLPLRLLPPEAAHNLTVRALRAGLYPRMRGRFDRTLKTRLWDLDFHSPIGLAAGFDKNAEAADAMLAMGFGFVEVGSVTPRPQPGNPRPRLFRLPEDRAVINRMGFNSDGHAVVEARLRRRLRRGLLGVNLGANKDSSDRMEDYVQGLRHLGPYADYVVVNVSSPNTPGLRDLQKGDNLELLAGRMSAARDEAGLAVPVLLKIAPDLDEEGLAAVAASARRFDGVIVGNTTLSRPEGLASPRAGEQGGLSGKPLFPLSTRVLARLYCLTGGAVPLIGTGGIASAEDAYMKIMAGASLVQLYTALIYEGPGLIGALNQGLADLLRRRGYSHLSDAVGARAEEIAGADWRPPS